MLVLAAMAVGLFALVEAVERLVCPWYAFARPESPIMVASSP
jgi:hypothetical protein